MKNSNYDIWAIQHNPEEVYTAIEGLENSSNNILYTNCKSNLRVGEQKIFVQFSTALLSEEKDRLIVLMKNGKLTTEEFKRLLDEKMIPYHEVEFMKTQPVTQQESKELWFAREQSVLRDALLDSKSKGIDICEYYPNLRGTFELKYPIDEEKLELLDKQGIRGTIVLDDKIILLMSNSHEMNIKYPTALRTLYETDMTPLVIVGEREIPKVQVAKQYKKEQ